MKQKFSEEKYNINLITSDNSSSTTTNNQLDYIKKHMTIMSNITFGIDPLPIVNLLLQLNVRELETLDPVLIYNTTKIFINGKWIGIHEEPIKLVHILNGVLKKWIKENKEVTSNVTSIKTSNYKSFEKSGARNSDSFSSQRRQTQSQGNSGK